MLLAALTGERLTPLRLAGLLLILLGVAIGSRGEEILGDTKSMNPRAQPGQRHLGVGWAFVSALGFGVLFWVLGTRAVPLLGSAQTVWLIRLTSVVLTSLVMLLLRQPKGLSQAGASWTVLGMGLLDTSAYVLNNYGIQLEQVSVVSALSSLYGAVTVVLAATILGEKVTRMQSTGIVAVLAGIVLISR
jgi:drug/metabolite transporter (DMT)-like permease